MPEAAPARMNWLKRHIPTQESLQRNRLLRPFARHLGDPFHDANCCRRWHAQPLVVDERPGHGPKRAARVSATVLV